MLSGLLPYCLEFSMPYDPMNQVHPGPLEGIDRIPAGWKLVPIEPTAEMWAAVNKLDDEMAAGAYDGKGASIEQVWNCLVETAPESPPITVALDPDPRGVSVGVWQGSRCIYTGAHPLPASVAPGDAQDDRLYQWPTTTARMKALAAELIFAANSMGGGGNDGEDVELVLSVAPAGTILLDEDPDVWNPGSLLTVHTKEYPDAGRYLVDPAQVSSDGTQCPAPTAGEAPPRFTISASDRFELTGAVGLLRGYGCEGAADALQRTLDAEMASFSVQGKEAAGNARDAARYRVVRMVAADKENGYALMAEASREVGIEVGRYPTPEQFDAVVDLVAAQQDKGGAA
ncbi:hypothetical protein [Bordetella bronchiseptica]|uniref:hypothetical protein n=1 Tax=Bordetella bronchiseptica TaxID=518 RepID=UPI000461ADB6|nr:hypothetical protein [Bordetella bronchiseptica]KDC47981.1 hypothetical protein L509_4170 [Bordetella bronchiseptica M85/00/2]